MKTFGLGLLLGMVIVAAPAGAEPYKSIFPNRSTLPDARHQAFLEQLDYRRGTIPLASAGVTLTIPKGYYLLGPEDTRKVLVEAWGNPSSHGQGKLAMLFPAAHTPLDDETWGAVITFEDDGRVSDDDVASIDYAGLLKTMQQDTAAESETRRKEGFPSIRLVGRSSPPFYDAAAKKLHWARELEFDGSPKHTLNYAVRALGREGVLQMNFVAGMHQLQYIKAAIPDVLKLIASTRVSAMRTGSRATKRRPTGLPA